MKQTLIVRIVQIIPFIGAVGSFRWIYEKIHRIGDTSFLFWTILTINLILGLIFGISGIEKYGETDTHKKSRHEKRVLYSQLTVLLIVFLTAAVTKTKIIASTFILAYAAGLFSSIVIAEPEKLITMYKYKPERTTNA